MIVEQKQISKTLLVFLDVESLRTGEELDDIYGEFYDLVNSAGAEIVGGKELATKVASEQKLDVDIVILFTSCTFTVTAHKKRIRCTTFAWLQQRFIAPLPTSTTKYQFC